MNALKSTIVAAVAACTVLVASSASYASVNTYGFYKLTNNNVESLASQLRVDVWDAAGAGSSAFTDFYAALGGFSGVSTINISPAGVLFVFRNNVGITSNVSEVYFDDGSLLAQSAIHNSISGSTSFANMPINPDNLPSGNTASPPFVATTGFSADSQGQSGINMSDDLLGLAYTLQGTQTYNDVISELADGTLRIGLHIRSIGVAGDSDSYINTLVIPEPTSLLVWSLLIGGTGLAFSRRVRRTEV